MALSGVRPRWLTFDCYGTLTQWDEGLLSAVEKILAKHGSAGNAIDPATLIDIYDRHEHRLEQTPPHRSFADVAGRALELAMQELGLGFSSDDAAVLTGSIAQMPPFPEVPAALAELKQLGYQLCVISNTDDAIIAGNLAQMGGHIDRVVTAEQARAYKPSARIFDYAHRELGVSRNEVVHICASPHLDLAAARDLKLRAVWINRGTAREALPDFEPCVELSTLDGVPGVLRGANWAS